MSLASPRVLFGGLRAIAGGTVRGIGLIFFVVGIAGIWLAGGANEVARAIAGSGRAR